MIDTQCSMVRINRTELTAQELSLLLSRLDTTLARLKKDDMHIFIGEILGKEERITLAKRLAAVVLLYEGYSCYRVSLLLKLSFTTTTKLRKKIETGAYACTVRLLTKKKLDYDELLNTIMSILHLGGILPQRVGLDRHRSIEERRAQYRTQKTNKRKQG